MPDEYKKEAELTTEPAASFTAPEANEQNAPASEAEAAAKAAQELPESPGALARVRAAFLALSGHLRRWLASASSSALPRLRAAFLALSDRLRRSLASIRPGDKGTLPAAPADRPRLENNLEKSQADFESELREVSHEKQAAPWKETEQLPGELEGRDAAITRLLQQRDALQASIEQMASALDRAREDLDLEKARGAGLQEELQRQLAGWRKEAAAQADATAALAQEKNLLQQSLDEAGKQAGELRAHLARREAEFHSEREDLRAQAERAQTAAAAATASLEQIQQQLKLLEKQKEKEAAQLAEQARWMHEELHRLRARVQELETDLSATEALRAEQGQMQRELKRKDTTLAVLREESHRLLTRAGKMESVLREFYTRAVRPLTIACASADLLPARSLAPEDAETAADLRENIRAVLHVLNTLVAKMSEMEISIEPPDAPPESPARHGEPAKPQDRSSPEPAAPKSEKAAGDRKPRRSIF